MPAENVIQLDDALKRRIDQLAQTNGMSPVDLLREAVEEFAARRNGGESPANSDSLWDAAARITAAVPDEEWAKLPSDLAKNFDHYHYGHPRED
jgi:predicted transcriptional regulator